MRHVVPPKSGLNEAAIVEAVALWRTKKGAVVGNGHREYNDER